MKKSIIILLICTCLFIGIDSVQATENIQYFANDTVSQGAQCQALLGDPSQNGSVAYYLQMALDIIKYLGIIFCIVLTTMDFFKAILGEDKDMTKNLSTKALQRVFYTVLLFFLPIIIKFLLTLIDVYGTCNVA